MEDRETTNLNTEDVRTEADAALEEAVLDTPDEEPASDASDNDEANAGDYDDLDDLTALTGLLSDRKKKSPAESDSGSEDAAVKARTRVANGQAEGEPEAEAKPVHTSREAVRPEKPANTGLPEDHPEMGELRERINERKKSYARRKRRFRSRFYIISWTIILLIAAFLFSISGFFTVDSIEVKGNSRFTAEEIINMGHATPGKNLIYSLDNAGIEEYLEGNPYIKNARVGRRLPSTMVITVRERTERMSFKYDDDYLVMDEDGLLLRKSRTEPMVTLIEGIVVNKIKLGEKIGATDNAKLKQAIEINKQADESDLYFVKVDISDDKIVKAYIYDTLVIKNDYDTLMENMENGRLHKVVEEVFKKGIKRGTISFDGDLSSFQPIF